MYCEIVRSTETISLVVWMQGMYVKLLVKSSRRRIPSTVACSGFFPFAFLLVVSFGVHLFLATPHAGCWKSADGGVEVPASRVVLFLLRGEMRLCTGRHR